MLDNRTPFRFKPSIFSDEKVDGFVEHGQTILEAVHVATGGRVKSYQNIIVWIDDGKPIPAKEWDATTVEDGQKLFIQTVPQGGGGDNKAMNSIMMLAVVVVAIAAPYMVGAAAGAASGTAAATWGAGSFGGAMMSMGIMVAGSFLVNMIAPIKAPEMEGGLSSKSDSQKYSISGARNRDNKFGTLPKVYGRVRTYPPYGALPYTELVGDDQYVRMLFDVGYGPLRLSEHKIGETPVEDYDDVEIVVHEGWELNPDYKIYTNDIFQEDLSISLTNEAGYQTRTTQTETDSISFDVSFSSLFQVAGTQYAETSVEIGAEISKDGITWESAFGPNASTSVQKITWLRGEKKTRQIRTDQGYRTTIYYVPSNTVLYFFDKATNLDDVVAGGKATISGAIDPVHNGTFKVDGIYVTDDYVRIIVENSKVSDESHDELSSPAIASVVSSSTVTITDNSTSTVRRGYTRRLPSNGQWSIRWWRVTPDDDTGQVRDLSYISNLRSIKDGTPSNWPVPACQVEMRIRATGQLNSIVDQYNCISESYLDVYDSDSETWTKDVTNNPAWVFTDILRGDACPSPVTDDRINLDQFSELAERCDDEGWFFNYSVDYATTVMELLSDVGSSCRASWTMYDNNHGVVIDKVHESPVALITPRNSAEFKGEKQFFEEVHAIRARFKNEDKAFDWDEQIVYRDGYSENGGDGTTIATEFQSLDFNGMTSFSQVWQQARYYLACQTYRPEVFSVRQDIEHLILNRGDMFVFQHDVPKFGVSTSARIKTITREDPEDPSSNVISVTTDDIFTLEGGDIYQARVREADGSFAAEQGRVEPSTTAEYTELTFTNSVGLGPDVAVGDLIALRNMDIDEAEMIVVGIVPEGDSAATIYFQEHAPSVHLSDQDEWPDWTSKITAEPNVRMIAPPAPTITNIISDETVIVRESDGSLSDRMVVDFLWVAGFWVGIVHFEVEHKSSTSQKWTREILPPDSKSYSVFDVVGGELYDLRIRAVSDVGAVSEWSYENSYQVIGKTSSPPSVDPVQFNNGILTWGYSNKPIDHKGYLVRYSTRTDSNWDLATPAHEGYLTTGDFDTSKFSGEAVLFLVKAVDVVGIESEAPQYVVLNLGEPSVENIIFEENYNPEFHGTIVGGVVVGGQIEANEISTYWGSDSDIYWGFNSDLFWPDNLYSKLTYEFCYIPDPTLVGERLILETTTTGPTSILYREYDESTVFWGGDTGTFWGDDDNLYWYGDENTPEWTPWPGSIDNIKETEYCFKIETQQGEIQGVISKVAVVIDTADIVEQHNDVAISATTGTRINLNKITRSVNYVNIRALHDSGGVSVVVVDKDVDLGPLIKVIDSTGAAVSGVVDASIGGY